MTLSPQQRADLKRFVRAHATRRFAVRAKIVRLAAEGHTNQEIAARLKISRPMVIRWRQAFQAEGIAALEKDGRRSRPFRTVGAAARKQIIASARSGLDSCGRPYSTRTLAAGQGCSHNSVSRILRQHGIPSPRAGWDVDGDRAFFRTLRDLFAVYAQPPDYALVFVATRTALDESARLKSATWQTGGFGPNDVFNARTFVNQLCGTHPLDEFLLRLWDADIQHVKGSVTESSEPRQRARLSKMLNRLIKGPLLYSRSLFSDVALDGQTQSLLGRPLRGRQLIRMNRRLLVLAYPSEFPEFFDLPFKKYRRGHWASPWPRRFKRVEALLRNPLSQQDRDDCVLQFLKLVDAQCSKDIGRNGDLWPLFPVVEWDADSIRNIPRYSGLHELHLIASSSFRRPRIKNWVAAHPHVHLHCLPAHGNWFSGMTRFFRQLRKVHYPLNMFRRPKDLWWNFEAPEGILGQLGTGQMDRLALTGWWDDPAFEFLD